MEASMAGGKALMKAARALEETLRDIRRDLHQHPEVAFQEKRTSAKVAEILRGLGIETTTNVNRTGVLGVLKGGRPGHVVGLRGDMDALPMQETNDVPYRSVNPGVCHACGHDAHTAMLLGAAMLLARARDQVPGTVKFFFQPAEESISGAEGMIAAGVMERPKVERVYGIHLRPEVPFGHIATAAGAMMAGANHFVVTVTGRGGHGAAPHMTAEPLPAAHAIYAGFQTLRRNVNALEPMVLSVCDFHSGTSFNIVPDEARMQGTLRFMNPEVKETVRQRMREIVKGAAAAFKVKAKLEFRMSCPALINDEAASRAVEAAARAVGVPVEKLAPVMTSEDFSLFAQAAPSALFRLGTRKPGWERTLHNGTFDFDDSALPVGAAVLAQCVFEW